MSLTDYKTTINGSVVNFNEIFSSASANSSSNIVGYKVNGNTETELTENSFSNDGDNILAVDSFVIEGYDNSYPLSNPPNDKSLAWGYNNGSKLGTQWGFDDKQRNVGYKTNADDIGPKCCAKFVDYTADSGNIPVPTWVDYFNVLAVGEGGGKGNGRYTHGNDSDERIRSQGTTGSSGGFIAWKSQTNLGNVYGFYYKVVFGSGSAEFQLYSPSAKVGWCKADKGIKGNNIHGNDDSDLHIGNTKSAGYDDNQDSLTSFSGGTLYGERFITGRPAHRHWIYSNPSDNLIADTVYGWSVPGYGRGQGYVGGDNGSSTQATSSPPGQAAVRVYYIGYPTDVS